MIYKNINDFLENEIDLENELICEIKFQKSFDNYDLFYIFNRILPMSVKYHKMNIAHNIRYILFSSGILTQLSAYQILKGLKSNIKY